MWDDSDPTTELPIDNVTDSNNTSVPSSIPAYTLALTFMSCALSILGSVLIFLTYYSFPEVREYYTRTLLVFLTAANVVNAAGNLMGTLRYWIFYGSGHSNYDWEPGADVCIFQSFITTYSSLCSFFWTVMIAFYIHMSMRKGEEVMKEKSSKLISHFLSWGIPGIITVIALFMGVLGEDFHVGSGAWCWIRTDLEKPLPVVWMFVTGKAWEILCYVITFTLFIDLKFRLLRRRDADGDREMSEVSGLCKADKNYLYVWLVLYLLRIWGTIRFFIAVASGTNEEGPMGVTQDVLLNLQSVGDSLQGFMNFVILCWFDEEVKTELKGLCRSCNIGMRKRKDNSLKKWAVDIESGSDGDTNDNQYRE